MHLVALLSNDTILNQILTRYHNQDLNVYLHPLEEPEELSTILSALAPLDFAGALILQPELQREAFQQASRSSLAAQDAKAADTISIIPGGMIADFHLGQAVVEGLRDLYWDGREAKAVILGSGQAAKAIARELASLGLAQLSLLAESPSEAEQSLPRVAANTQVTTRAYSDPLRQSLLEQADLIVRLDPQFTIPRHILGPHLSLVDYSGQVLSSTRQDAINVGASTLSYRDIQARQITLALGHLLGVRLNAGTFLELLHPLEH